MLKNTFKKTERLRLRKEFQLIHEYGKKLISNNFIIIYRKNDFDYSRIGISVKKKFGKAYIRNRLRRQIKEIYRKNKSIIPNGYDFLFIPRKNLSMIYISKSYFEIQEMILNLLGKLK